MSTKSPTPNETRAVSEETWRARPQDARFVQIDQRHLDLCEGELTEAFLLAKLMQWGNRWRKGDTSRAFDDPEVRRSFSQLQGDLLGLWGHCALRKAMVGLERRGFLRTKSPGTGRSNKEQIPVRMLNTKLINERLTAWENPESPVRRTRVAGKAFLLEQKDETGAWAPFSATRFLKSESSVPESSKQHTENPSETRKQGSCFQRGLIKERGKDEPQGKELLETTAPGGGAGGSNVGSPDFDGIELEPPLGATFFGSILDQASKEEVQQAIQLLKEIKQAGTLDFIYPSPGKRPSATFVSMVTYILQLLKGEFSPPLTTAFRDLLGDFTYKAPPSFQDLKRDLFEAIEIGLADAAASSQRVPSLSDWMFRDHGNGAGTSSLLLCLKKGRRKQEAQKPRESQETRYKLLAGPEAWKEATSLWDRYPNSRPNDVGTFWGRLLQIEEHCNTRKFAIMSHGWLTHGRFRGKQVPNSVQVMYLLGRWAVEMERQDPGAWIPAVGDEVWLAMSAWGRNLGVGEAFDLDAAPGVSLEEAKEQAQEREALELSQRLGQDPKYAVAEEVALEAVQEKNPNVRKLTPAMLIHTTRLLQLTRACFIGRPLYPPLPAIRALRMEAQQTCPPEAHPFEERAWVELGVDAIEKIQRLWEEDEPSVLKQAQDLGLFDGLE